MKLTEAGMGRAEIIERLEKLTRPDREVDAEVALTCGWLAPIEKGSCGPLYSGRDRYEWHDESGEARGFKPPRFTASLDAAVALVEKMGERPEDMLPEAIEALLTDGYRDDAPRTPQFAIALLIALFRSLPDTEER